MYRFIPIVAIGALLITVCQVSAAPAPRTNEPTLPGGSLPLSDPRPGLAHLFFACPCRCSLRLLGQGMVVPVSWFTLLCLSVYNSIKSDSDLQERFQSSTSPGRLTVFFLWTA